VRLHLIRDAVRAKQIVTVLLRYRFDELLEATDAPPQWLSRIIPPVHGDIPVAKRIRLAIEELGPTFIKLGQVLSTRPDLLPADWIEELAALRDQVKALPFTQIRPLLESELGRPIESVFTAFEETPSASGSLGQIHRAKLLRSEQPVAVKIQKPGLHQTVQTDFEILAWIINQVHLNLPALRAYDLPAVVEELREGLLQELDFSVEARQATTFNALNQFPDDVFAPAVLGEFTTPRLLVSEWVDGTRPTDLADSPARRAALARLGGRSFFSQIAETGFFHGDPHPGNILITADNRICLLDWGLVGMLTNGMRHVLVDLFAACGQRDAAAITAIALQLGYRPQRPRHAPLEKAVTTILFKHEEHLRHMENIGSVILELVYVFGSHGIEVARDYTLLAKAILSIERTATLIDPHFNLAAVGAPYVRRLQRQRWDPRHLAATALSRWSTALHPFEELPADLQRVLHQLEAGRLRFQLDHLEVRQATQTIHHAFSRLSLAVIIGSLVIASSLVINTGIQPFLWGYPAIGIIGYLLSAAIGSYVAFDILRSGHPRH
jgi:ubiquinone biosynthesis protein